jgi:DNA-binding transcriptional ArsR family regulator
MKKKIILDYKDLADTVKALAHPTRLFIVDTLSSKDLCVCELTDMIGADISTVSKHLSLLRNSGIVGYRKEGTKLIYTLKTPCILNFLKCIESVIIDQAKEKLGRLNK